MNKNDIYKLLIQNIDEKSIFCDEPMRNHTTFKIGGTADFFVKAKNLEEIEFILNICKKYNIKLTLVGNGSNLLVKDNGIRGIVLKPELTDIKIEDNFVIADSGVLLTVLAKKTVDLGLKGLEFAYGIPGTLGGAIRMNAGAYGGEIKDVVVETTYITYDGQICKINNNQHEFFYRDSIFSKLNAVILSTKIKLEYSTKEELQELIVENMSKRRNSQPLEFPNAGSTFKRGDGYVTARLIDEAGLKGYTVGDAMVSLKHAGFIVNKGNATANDILKLIEIIKKTLLEKYEKEIELEIIILGE